MAKHAVENENYMRKQNMKILLCWGIACKTNRMEIYTQRLLIRHKIIE